MQTNKIRITNRIQTCTATLAVATAVMLAACGGSSNSDSSPITSNSPSGSNASNSTGPSSTAETFFDSVFLKDSGTGFFQFGANLDSSKGTPTATGRTQFYVNSDSEANFAEVGSVILGPYTQEHDDQAYISSEGAVTSSSTPYIDIGSSSKIFQILPQGYQLGMNGMSSALYEVTVTPQDVSGLPVSQAIDKDEGPSTNGLSVLLGQDTTPMPQGAQMYRLPYKVLTTHLSLNLSTAKTGWNSLEQVQSTTGGTIQSLGGYRYLKPASNSVTCIEYNGAVFIGDLLNAGDEHDTVPAAYNRIAADFIAQEQQKAGLRQ
ncbi:hypothetical protein PQQ73_02345 [Paraburkholderia strydomiana]|uniref:Uncharacterized protein n=1 Tax=Paraburkholderia strydomiana TaxID=1245417 RepID=A0ABW9E7U7_9BURK